MILSKKKANTRPPKHLTPVQELYIELLKYRFPVVSVKRNNNIITVQTQGVGDDYEFSYHYLNPA